MHNRRDLSDFRSKSMGVPAGDLDGLMSPFTFNQLNSVIVDPSVLGDFRSQVQTKHVHKVTYLSETFVEASSVIKPALWGLKDRWTPSSSSGYSGLWYTIELTICLTSLLSLSALALPPLPTTSSSSTLEADEMDNPVIFNIAVSDITIMLKP